MAKKPQYKLRFKPTPISRLKHYKTPIRMVGDPNWWSTSPASYKGAWEAREKKVYEYEIDRKSQDSRGWSHATYYEAYEYDEYLCELFARKWEDYKEALNEALYWDYEDALRDNAAWDYHHDNFIAA